MYEVESMVESHSDVISAETLMNVYVKNTDTGEVRKMPDVSILDMVDFSDAEWELCDKLDATKLFKSEGVWHLEHGCTLETFDKWGDVIDHLRGLDFA